MASNNQADEALVDTIARAVAQRLDGGGSALGDIQRIVAEELNQGANSLSLQNAGTLASMPESKGSSSRVVITANGRNRSGVVARLATAIDEFSGDIHDLSQTIVGDYFTMLFVVDIVGAPYEGARFLQLRQRLQEVGRELGAHVVVMHDDILSSMHSV